MTPESVRELFTYDAAHGALLWRIKRPGRGCVVGAEAGTVNRRKDTTYRVVCVFGRKYYAHRLVWMFHHGDLAPDLVIDHINGDGSDNRLENLRLVTKTVNQRNRRRSSNGSTTGVGGVAIHRGGFVVYIASRYVGWRRDFFEACCLRKSRERALGFTFNGVST